MANLEIFLTISNYVETKAIFLSAICHKQNTFHPQKIHPSICHDNHYHSNRK